MNYFVDQQSDQSSEHNNLQNGNDQPNTSQDQPIVDYDDELYPNQEQHPIYGSYLLGIWFDPLYD